MKTLSILVVEDRAPAGSNLNTAEPHYLKLRNCVELICNELMVYSLNLKYAIPVRLGHDYNEPYYSVPAQWALYLSSNEGTNVLLPLSLSVRGPKINNGKLPISCTSNWRPCSKSSGYYRYFTWQMLKCFSVMIPASGGHAALTLLGYSMILHYMQQGQATASAEYAGDIRVFTWLLRKPCKLVRLQDFTLTHTGTESEKQCELTRSMIRIFSERSKELSSEATSYPATSETGGDEVRGIGEDEGTAFCSTDNRLQSAGMKGFKVKGEPEEKNEPNTRREYSSTSLIWKSYKEQLQRGLYRVNDMPKCCFMSCPRPQDAFSKYCDAHSTALIEYVATHKSWLPTTVEWTSCPTPDTRIELQLLKAWHSHSPEDVWIVDFEFVTVGGTASPIPVQLAIRQIDGVLLLETNVDYCLSFDEFSDNIGPLRTERYLVPQILQRCYGSGPRTNGLAPTEI
ncbi:uncharacterized protein BO88DRAFT_437653 [Aspergillus vadensis CBS 113365]|uniref:Uncharacterized protein n=1 Tax=Aspergillus vadensis (strain CBS 113365 / IMI 142717 / IBT 24658) TaxID=1448311 RepID=A0A319CBX4_ASPVC|nr:hypothetical protein BO88DRAFT_437653 [Aspergillus vadensis CBS 113365]PYH65982.1 hypothetical protein BO88DRAFT_437653 [Aspergillus vadensis CBS 113365]